MVGVSAISIVKDKKKKKLEANKTEMTKDGS
jgi:hypothetical protein